MNDDLSTPSTAYGAYLAQVIRAVTAARVPAPAAVVPSVVVAPAAAALR
jgi:hypothetical protein